MPYVPDRVHDDTACFGASLKAFVKLGNRLGYELVACSAVGTKRLFREI